jgi:uncharacterized protein
MSLVQKINDDLKAAMMAKEKEKLEAIRSIKAAFLLAKTEEGGTGEISDEKALIIIQKLHKQRKESAEIYKNAAREELAQKENFEASVLEQYLPAQMSEAEMESIIRTIIAESGATSVKEMGKVMGIAAKQLAGKASNKAISDKVRQLLS